MPRPIRAVIDTQAISHNFLTIKRHLDSQGIHSYLWSVIKANAYGHGIEHVVGALNNISDGFAMLDFAEAVRTRAVGWKGPILMLEGFFDRSDLDVITQYQLTTAVHSWHQIELLKNYTTTHKIPVWVKLNSGMNRLGFQPNEYQDAYQQLLSMSHVDVVGKMTHFANADTPMGVTEQLAVFKQATQNLPGQICICNSAATWRYAELDHNWVRAGIMLYGSSPFADQASQDLGLQNTMSLEAEIIGIQTLKPGDKVGYGSRFVASHSMRIGVVACGYADGYPRIAPDGTPVVVDNQRTQLVGRVSMDMLTVDLTQLPNANIGSKVVLWGHPLLTADEVAAHCQTIAYELFTALTPRVPVLLKD